jgi:hypothetical protein
MTNNSSTQLGSYESSNLNFHLLTFSTSLYASCVPSAILLLTCAFALIALLSPRLFSPISTCARASVRQKAHRPFRSALRMPLGSRHPSPAPATQPSNLVYEELRCPNLRGWSSFKGGRVGRNNRPSNVRLIRICCSFMLELIILGTRGLPEPKNRPQKPIPLSLIAQSQNSSTRNLRFLISAVYYLQLSLIFQHSNI